MKIKTKQQKTNTNQTSQTKKQQVKSEIILEKNAFSVSGVIINLYSSHAYYRE